ncbi:hypothetical protein FRC04_007966 [Tulasnella sp. 424]|nr:hypothetical protein FRC04_007966 [Tulasnella sp. 424]KAG8974827.1 hypothetical protein FRC05_006759 [Tulasnella sp. 425]
MSTAETPLLNARDPDTRLVLKLLRLQVLTPLAVLVNIATFLICSIVVKPSMRDLNRAFPTAVTPNAGMIAMLWIVVFAGEVLFCMLLVGGRKHDTRETMVYGVGLRLVIANWIMVAWSIVFTLKLWLPSTILLGVLTLFILWINFTLIWHPPTASRPADFIAIHLPIRLWLIILLLSSLPQSIFITLDWVFSPDHPEVDYDNRSWQALAFILGTNALGLIWVLMKRDLVWTVGGVWVMVALMSKRPKGVPVFTATILVAVLYPLVWITSLAWHRLREKGELRVLWKPIPPPTTVTGV